MKKTPGLVIILVFVVVALSGCVDTDRIVAMEAKKLAKIQLGMSIADVNNIMGTEMIDFGSQFEARPIRTDKFMSKEGDLIEVHYYRSSIKRNDGVCTDDETTAVIFVKGKVDAITSGDTSKTVIEVRRR